MFGTRYKCYQMVWWCRIPPHRRSKRLWIWPMRPTRRRFLWCRCLAIAAIACVIFHNADQNLEVHCANARQCLELGIAKHHEKNMKNREKTVKKPRLQRITLRTNPTTAIRATPRMWTSLTPAETSRRSPTSPISRPTSPPTRPKLKRLALCLHWLHSVTLCHTILHNVTLNELVFWKLRWPQLAIPSVVSKRSTWQLCGHLRPQCRAHWPRSTDVFHRESHHKWTAAESLECDTVRAVTSPEPSQISACYIILKISMYWICQEHDSC